MWTELPVPTEQIAAYLGYPKGTVLSARQEADICAAWDDVVKTAQPKMHATAPLPITQAGDVLRIGPMRAEGVDIRAHLEHCKKAILLGVTLGNAVDAKIRTYEVTDMAKAVSLDAAANVAVEAATDDFEETLRTAQSAQGLYVTGRFSPGYGDFPLDVQKEVLALLDAPRKLGLTLTPSQLMVPRKSVTAILGLADIFVTGKPATCRHCVLKEKCMYRKRGTTCAE